MTKDRCCAGEQAEGSSKRGSDSPENISVGDEHRPSSADAAATEIPPSEATDVSSVSVSSPPTSFGGGFPGVRFAQNCLLNFSRFGQRDSYSSVVERVYGVWTNPVMVCLISLIAAVGFSHIGDVLLVALDLLQWVALIFQTLGVL